jgi:glycosyltransferase involved in cell wall biosynthesis
VRILIVTQYFWPEEFRINDLALGLLSRGHSVTVLTGKPNYPGGRFFAGYRFFGKPAESFEGVQIHRVPLIPRGSGNSIRLMFNYLSFAILASLLGPLACRGQYDVILVFEPSPVTVGLPARVLGLLKKVPILFWVQDLWPESLEATGAVRSPRILGWVQQLTRFIYNGCDRILVQSRAFIEPIQKLGIPPDVICYFPNSAESLYAPVRLTSDASERALLPSGFCVMFAGNIGAAQDFETILGAADRLREHTDIQWIVLGDGRLAPWVRDQIRARALERNMRLLGRHPVTAMPRFFAAADALLVTLKREPIFALTIPSKIQSYLACGRPIIATLEGEGARIVVESGAGLVARPEDAESLAHAVLAMARMPVAKRDAMGVAGRRYFEQHFERERLLGQLEGWMKDLTALRT